MKKIPYIHCMTVLVMLILSVIFTVSQVLLVWNFYEPDVYLYAHGTCLPDIFNIALSVFVILNLVVFAFFNKDSYPDTLAKTSTASRYTAFLSGLALPVLAIDNLTEYMNRTSNIMYIEQRQDKFILWSSIVALAAFIYFIAVSFTSDKRTRLRSWFGSIAVIWHILYLLAIYFDMSNPLNNPVRLMSEFALVAAMMYLTVEIRAFLGIPKKGLYISTSVIAITLLLTSSISNLICGLAGKLPLDIGTLSLNVYLFFMAIYILTRLLSQLTYKEKIHEQKESVAS